MKRVQVSSNIGLASIATGFLAIFQNVPIDEFGDVFMKLTGGELLTLIAPLVLGFIAIIHDEAHHKK